MTSRIKILVVEDEAITVMALKMELDQAGFHVIGSAASGEETLSAITRERPDVILMDVRLAGSLSGLETAIQIRQTDRVPIVFMTGYSDAELIVWVNEMGSATYVVKPIMIDVLKAAIESVLRK